MVAGLFAHHGLWVGQEYATGSGLGADYVAYENVAIKEWLRARYGLQGSDLVSKTQAAEFAEFMRNLVPAGRRFLFKGGVMFWPLFEQFKPHLVFVKRNLESSVAAIMNRPNAGAEDYVRETIVRRYALMDAIHETHGGTVIDTDKLITGDYSNIKAAFDDCGLEFVEEIAEKLIEPERWHFPKGEALRL
jgi:hypothetical protein